MDAMKKYGLLSGFTFAAWQYLEYYSGLHESGVAAYTGFVPAPLFVFFLFLALRQKRTEMGGYMEFADGLKTGLGVSAIAGVIYSIAFYAYCKWVNPQWVLDAAEKFSKNLALQTPTVLDVDAQTQDFIENYAFRSSIMAMVSLLFMGGIISVIMAAVMRKKPPAEAASDI